ncbi:MAG TPA: S8 family peptidase [Bryobacteraceae bacterium]|nr:S8 family peptidase [Bryobacteraceae bacterium]
MAMSPQATSSRPRFINRVVVKFLEHLQIPYEDGLNERLDELAIGSWKDLASRFPGISIHRMYTSVKPEELQRLVTTATRRDPSYQPRDLLTYFVIECPPQVNPDELVKALSAWRTVEKAYFDPPGSEPLVNPGDDPRSPNQGYLDPAPTGIDAEYAWGFPGGDGAGQQVIDLERGWTLDHEDLVALGATLIHGSIRDGSRPHGTSVLGEICAVDNSLGCVGITPNVASVQVTSYWDSTRANAMMAAIAVLPFGGVLLLEAQLNANIGGVNWVNLPIEALDAEFETIRLATALGITVVEAAGNGSNDLDTFADDLGRQVLNRSSGNFRDSGAIMVGAGSSTVPHARLGFSNFGSRIDCYGWGEDVDTATSNTTMPFNTTSYTGGFNGTSSASPIITGAALAVQGIAEASSGFRFNPLQLRAILSNAATGTASANPAVDRIGVMPNLRAIIDQDIIGVAPDIYLRDFVGDVGDPHVGAISASPDVILRKEPVANPEAAFGEGSGFEDDATLGYEAEAGQDNFIYLRVRNRGGSNATNVNGMVYWSPVSTLVTPDLWTLVGSVNIPLVPAGDTLTVSDSIVWPSAEIPGTGHYCLVGLIGTAADPAPNPAVLFDWDTFRAFIRNNNNVTWRNFNVVDNDPDVSMDPNYVVLPFLAAGAPRQSLRMRLEVVARLPRGSKAMLELPFQMREVLQGFGPFHVGKDRRSFQIPVNAHGIRRLPEISFPAKARMPLRLLVHIPEEYRAKPYEVYVRQIFKKEEVGRVTWRLMKRNKQ